MSMSNQGAGSLGSTTSTISSRTKVRPHADPKYAFCSATMFSIVATVHRGWTVPAGPTTRFTDTFATGPPAATGVTRTPSSAGPHGPAVRLANWSVVVVADAVNVHSLAFH